MACTVSVEGLLASFDVVEELEWALEKFLEIFKRIPDSIKISLLLDAYAYMAPLIQFLEHLRSYAQN